MFHVLASAKQPKQGNGNPLNSGYSITPYLQEIFLSL